MPKYRKTYKKTTRHHRSRTRGKGKEKNHRLNLKVVLFLVAIFIIIRIVLYVLRQFSLLLNKPSTVSPAGWMVIALLSFMGGTFAYIRIRRLIREMKARRVYEGSIHHEETGSSYRKVKETPGALFEYRVSKALEDAYPDKTQWVNALFKRKNSVNEYAEIDVLLFHESGLYVIECKDYDGYVYGGLTSAYWTVGYENGGFKKTYEFQNPVLQNRGHIKDVKSHVGVTCHNIVLFSEKTALDTDIHEIETIGSLRRRIDSAEGIYSENDLNTFKNALSQVRKEDAAQEHVNRIKFNRTKYTG